MPSKQYPFIDIAVHDQVRQRFAAGEALVLFSPDMEKVLWANGAGANLFNHDFIYDFLDAGLPLSDVTSRQIKATAGQLHNVGDKRSFLMRMTTNFQRVTIQANLEILTDRSGDRVTLFSAPVTDKPLPLSKRAASMLSGFDDPDTHMAVLGAGGDVLACSPGFSNLGMTEETLLALVRAVSRDSDQLLKRPVPTGRGYLPAAIGKLSDDPALNLLFCVETAIGQMDPTNDDTFGEQKETASENLVSAVSSHTSEVGFDDALDAVSHIEESTDEPDETDAIVADSPQFIEPVSEDLNLASGLQMLHGTHVDDLSLSYANETADDLADLMALRHLDAVPHDETYSQSAIPEEFEAEYHAFSTNQIHSVVDEVAEVSDTGSDPEHFENEAAEQIDMQELDTAADLPVENTLASVDGMDGGSFDVTEDTATESALFAPTPDLQVPYLNSVDETEEKSGPVELDLAGTEAEQPADLDGVMSEIAETNIEDTSDVSDAVLPVNGGLDDAVANPEQPENQADHSAEDRILEENGAPVETAVLVEPNGQSADDATTMEVSADATPAAPQAFAFQRNTRPVRFVWKVDANGRFSEISDEFAEAVGPKAAAINDLYFADVARAFKMDPDSKIGDLLQKRDTWSGKTIYWPVEGTALKVPVDLAALPTYSRSRSFDGFRGFGIVRLVDAIEDPDQIGLTLVKNHSTDNELPTLNEDFSEVSAPLEFLEEPAGHDLETVAGPEATIGEPVTDLGSEHTFSATTGDLDRADETTADEPPHIEDEDPEHTEATAEFEAAEHSIDDIDNVADEESPVIKPTAIEAGTAVAEETIDATDTLSADFLDESLRTTETTAEIPESNSGVEMPTDPSSTPVDEFQGERPALRIVETPGRRHSDKVVSFDAHRGKSREGLSLSEQAAFHEIARQLDPFGKRLSQESLKDQTTRLEGTFPSAPVTGPSNEATAENGEISEQTTNIDPLAAPVSPDEVAGLIPSRTKSEEQLSASFVDALPLAILVHTGENLIHANPEFFRLTGYASLKQLKDYGGLDALLEQDQTNQGTDETPSMMMVTVDGALEPVTARLQSIRWEDSHALLLALVPKRTDGERAAAAKAASVDDSLDPAAKIKALTVEVDELRSILETATDGVVIVSQDGEIRSMNKSASALFNFDDEDTRGKSFAMLFAHESQKAVMDYLSGLAGHGVASVLNDGREVIGRESSGGFIPLFMTMGRLSSSNGYCAVIRDITQWKRTEEELRTAKRAAETANAHKSEFLARVSHEIRTPLNAIIGFSDMMATERLGPIGHPRYVEYSDDIGRSGRHVLDIVNDLLDISKIEAGEMDLDFTSVELNEAVSEAVSLVQPQVNSQRVIIRTSLSQSVPNIVADQRSIKQIVINILANSIRYTPSGGQIVVSTAYETNGSVVLRIRDTGIGMTRAELEQALKPFRQVTTGSRKRGDGTGLGLPLTKAMVDANRANFAISSTPNEGTLVEITFPSPRVLAN